MTTLEHALRLCELLALDLARLAESCPDAVRVLDKCGDHRIEIVNRLEYVRMNGFRCQLVPASENKTIETRSKLVEEIGESGQVIRVRVLYTMRCEDGDLSITSVHKGYIADMSDLQELWGDCLTVEKE